MQLILKVNAFIQFWHFFFKSMFTRHSLSRQIFTVHWWPKEKAKHIPQTFNIIPIKWLSSSGIAIGRVTSHKVSNSCCLNEYTSCDVVAIDWICLFPIWWNGFQSHGNIWIERNFFGTILTTQELSTKCFRQQKCHNHSHWQIFWAETEKLAKLPESTIGKMNNDALEKQKRTTSNRTMHLIVRFVHRTIIPFMHRRSTIITRFKCHRRECMRLFACL